MWIPKDTIASPLYVVTCVFNPQRFKRRWKLYRDFQKHVRDAGAILVTVEAAFGEREFALGEHAEPLRSTDAVSLQARSHGPPPVPAAGLMPPSRAFQDYIKVRVVDRQEIWLKENLLNLAAQHLPTDAEYVAFVDADVQFVRPDWVSETLHALQHFAVVQMFSTVIDLSPQHEPLLAHRGFAWCHATGMDPALSLPNGYYGRHVPPERPFVKTWHPGFAWAWRREALDAVGGLIDHAILGAGDNHMARALVGRARSSIADGVHPKYAERVLRWQDRALRHLKKNVGHIDGLLLHHWHGRKLNRRYQDRWQLLIKHGFNPEADLKRNWRGVYALTDRKPALRDAIRRYFRARHEDSIDVPEEDEKILGPAPGWQP